MKIKKLHIKNFKSIADLEIIEPNPFTVFVGPNGSGKSNIFEALEFFIIPLPIEDKVHLFGGKEEINKRDISDKECQIEIIHEFFDFSESTSFYPNTEIIPSEKLNDLIRDSSEEEGIAEGNFRYSFRRLFLKNLEKQKINFSDSYKLSFSGNNLEKVLKRILLDESKKEEISEWLDLFVPGFERVEVFSSYLSNTDTLLIYEKGIKKPFPENLISDGTYNILALLTAVFQSDEPQFLCIEEPENGLTPDVIKEMVNFFRNACEEKGHYIWLNTHSQSLVSQLSPDEIITVNKIKGETKIKQFKGEDFNGLSMDEAWLTNTLEAGLPW